MKKSKFQKKLDKAYILYTLKELLNYIQNEESLNFLPSSFGLRALDRISGFCSLIDILYVNNKISSEQHLILIWFIIDNKPKKGDPYYEHYWRKSSGYYFNTYDWEIRTNWLIYKIKEYEKISTRILYRNAILGYINSLCNSGLAFFRRIADSIGSFWAPRIFND